MKIFCETYFKADPRFPVVNGVVAFTGICMITSQVETLLRGDLTIEIDHIPVELNRPIVYQC